MRARRVLAGLAVCAALLFTGCGGSDFEVVAKQKIRTGDDLYYVVQYRASGEIVEWRGEELLGFVPPCFSQAVVGEELPEICR